MANDKITFPITVHAAQHANGALCKIDRDTGFAIDRLERAVT